MKKKQPKEKVSSMSEIKFVENKCFPWKYSIAKKTSSNSECESIKNAKFK
jgi:hypothetical protein